MTSKVLKFKKKIKIPPPRRNALIIEIDKNKFENITLFCPTYSSEKNNINFAAFGDKKNFKIAVFTNEEYYKKGFQYLKLDQKKQKYKLYTTKMTLFIQLAANDPGFKGLIVNIPEEKIILDSKKILKFHKKKEKNDE